ncbi:MAG: hypothetical protein L3K52_02385 [Candidatus Thiothrix sulfatifontis]|nr:MAG: hypothetical protein L3K52_02385 [Candidatus Thiothrix sulfatifontis]
MFAFEYTERKLVGLHRQYSYYILLVASMVIITGCGGGGNSSTSDTPNPSDNATATVTSTPPVTPTPTVVVNTDTTPLNPLYTGKREQARLTEEATMQFIEWGDFFVSDGGYRPVPVALLYLPIVFSGTIPCFMSGEITRTSNETSLDDGGSKYVRQDIYNACGTEIAVLNGSNTYTRINIESPSKTITYGYNYDYTVKSASVDYIDVYNGDTLLTKKDNNLTVKQNLYIKEENVESLKFNLQYLGTGDEQQGVITEMTGQTYVGDYGYVTPKVIQPLYFSGGLIFSGELILNGANNSKAQILPTSTKTIVLNIDEDGDGAYEKTRNLTWSRL